MISKVFWSGVHYDVRTVPWVHGPPITSSRPLHQLTSLEGSTSLDLLHVDTQSVRLVTIKRLLIMHIFTSANWCGDYAIRSVRRIAGKVISRFHLNLVLWLCLPIGRTGWLFGDDTIPNTDYESLFRFAHQCRIRDGFEEIC